MKEALFEAQTFYAFTKDRWKIALHRYPRPEANGSPILLVHGFSSNRLSFDFPFREKSLAKFLWRKGWDTWLIDLRGAGQSTKPQGLEWFYKKWCFDHYLQYDVPTALSLILKETRRKKVHWIGHSLGGVLIYPYVKLFGAEKIKSVVMMGTPMMTGVQPNYWDLISLISPLFRLIPMIPNRTLLKLLRLPPRWMLRSHQGKLFSIQNMDHETLALSLEETLEDISSEVFCQVESWVRGGKFQSLDGKINYWYHPRKFQLPLLVLTGALDSLTPRSKIAPIFEKFGSKKKKWIECGKEGGFATDYGHVDLILGKNAPREIYPIISKWLQENEEEVSEA